MNRINTRLRTRFCAPGAALAASALLVAAALTGCGTGQLSQSASQAAAVNGTEGVVGHLALRNVRIEAEQAGDAIDPGETVDLLFVASNQSPDTDDELTGITTPIGKVAMGGSKKLPAGGMLIAHPPDGEDAAPMKVIQELRDTEDANAATARVTLDKPVSNGLTYDVTFDFKKAGDITLEMPISAPPISESSESAQ